MICCIAIHEFAILQGGEFAFRHGANMDADAQQAVSPPTNSAATPEYDVDFEALPRRQIVFTMAGLMLALFLAALDQTVISTAMPRIIADLGGFDRFTWITTSYLVASTTAVPIVGRLSDLYGRKTFFLAGIIVFLIGSVLAGASETMNQLIFFRAIQGLGGGSIMALSFASVGDLFPPAERGKYQGVVAGVFGLASVIGPTLGGFITDNVSWNWVFYINLPLALPVIGLFIWFFPNIKPAKTTHRLDYLGMALLVLIVVPLLVGLSLGGIQYDWASPQILGVLVFAALMIAAFIMVERRAAEPIMPLSIYSNRVVSISLIAVFATGFGMFGAIIFVPLFFQGVLGASATSSGSFLTPMMLSMVVAAAVAGQTLSRLGGHYRIQGLIGIGVMTVGMVLLSLMTADTSFVQAVASIMIMGAGLGITFPSFTISVQNAVPHNLLGVVTSATQFYRSVGGALGLAVLGSYMASRFASGLKDALSPAVKDALSADQLAEMSNNPQALVDPKALEQLRATFADKGEEGAAITEQLLTNLRETLASAIGDVFILGAATLALAFVVTIFLKEVPLKGRGKGSGPVEG
jgi:EmrB/QacA subfamily drug resistance transporter